MKKIGSGSRSPRSLQAAPELIEIQAFMPMDPADRERLKKDIEETGEIRDPLKIYKDRRTGQDLILGGYNRQQIAIELGIDLVPVDEYEGTPAERRDLVVKDNLNRRHMTAEQKRALIRYFYKQDPGQSARTVSKKTGVDHKTVQRVKADMSAGGEIPHLTAVRGRDGKTYRKPVKKPDREPRGHVSRAEIKKRLKQYLQLQRDPQTAARDIIDFINKTLKSIK